MDQDFHYYGTYYAARIAGYDQGDATLIGKASNFIDFLHEGEYSGYWKLVRDTQVTDDWAVVAEVTNPRYTFQAGLLSTGMSPEDGLWCSYHFTPGNYAHEAGDDGWSSKEALHGVEVADTLPTFEVRTIKPRLADKKKLLNRPQSPLAHALLADAIACANSESRLEKILARAQGGWELLRAPNKADCIKRFNLILLGVRAHVIADTWAHQDWAGISNDINIYFDIDSSSVGRQAIKYTDSKGEHKVILKSSNHENLQAVPNGTSYLEHGWMGHFPDYSFVKYEYKPRWRKQEDPSLVRDNPLEYRSAFLELCSLMSRSRGQTFSPMKNREKMKAAETAWSTPCEIADRSVCPRQFSSLAWRKEMAKAHIEAPSTLINAKLEPDPRAVMDGLLHKTKSMKTTRYGTLTINAKSDLYLFQIAADYHFHFVRHWLKQKGIMEFEGSWSQKLGPLPHLITDLF